MRLTWYIVSRQMASSLRVHFDITHLSTMNYMHVLLID